MGKNAHRILDHAIHPDYLMDNGKPVGNALVFVKTPRFGWHFATLREKEILNKKYNYNLWTI